MKFSSLIKVVSQIIVLQVLLVGPAVSQPLLAADDPEGAKNPPFNLSDETRINIGKKRFNSTCAAYCHGAEGSGGKVTPFKGNKELPIDKIYKTIVEGRRTSDIMPPWGHTFTSAEVWELVAYIHFLTQQPPAN